MVGSRNPTAAGRKTARGFRRLVRARRTDDHERARRWASTRPATRARSWSTAVRPSRSAAPVSTGLSVDNTRAGGAHSRKRGAGVASSRRERRPRSATSRGATASSAGCRTARWSWRRTCRSGSLSHGAAARPNRGGDVFAIPGSIHSPLARGCHQADHATARSLVETARGCAARSCKFPCPNEGLVHRERAVGTAPPHWTRSMKCC